MPEKALEALKDAYRSQVAWMHRQADKLESGKSQHLEEVGALVKNVSSELAEDFRHRANNLQAAIDAYERLTVGKMSGEPRQVTANAGRVATS